jgi:thiamine-phosphate pyrophosphorylase
VTAVPRLLVVTDRRLAGERPLVDVVRSAVAGGARAVLLREKDLPVAERRRLAIELAGVLAPAGGTLVVAGDPALAAELGAGLHLASGQPLAPAPEVGAPASTSGARTQHGLVGRSCHGPAELAAARREGVAYATLSPVFPTASKPGYGPALGPDGLADAVAAVPDLPVLALGGVGPGRVAACRSAGAHGVAVMGEVMRAGDPAEVVRRLHAELERVEPAEATR